MPTPEQVRGDKEQDGDAGINASTRNNGSPSRCSEDDNSGMTKDDAKARFYGKFWSWRTHGANFCVSDGTLQQSL